MQPVRSISQILHEAKEAEKEDDLEHAIALYEQVIKEDSLKVYPYNRLMIIYRKLKLYKHEARIIKAGIKAFEKMYKPNLKSGKGKKIAELSIALSKATGLADKKGIVQYEQEPIGSWKKRLAIVEKKL